jgi:UDP-N-acetyl-D-glucosamine dehydrogenase
MKKKLCAGVIGLGYVGLPLAVEFAKKGVAIIGIEVDKDRLNSLKRKESYISDVPTKALKGLINKGLFCATDDFSAAKGCDVVLVCVPTPLKKKNIPNIAYIKEAVESVAAYVKRGALIVLESTTYPGTTEEEVMPIFKKNGLEHGKDYFLCFSPERIDPGNIKFPVNKIPKVVGGVSPKATELGVKFYKRIIDKVVPVSSARTAETVKLLENTYRLINIGLIDELAMMTHKMNIDIWEVVEAAATKPFGFMPFYPGPGVGGHCIPKDPLYLYWKARKFGFYSRFIHLASEIISYMPHYVAGRIKEALSLRKIRFKGAKIMVVGVTYKKDTKDLRQSPSLDLILSLKSKGAVVSYSDPLIPYLKFSSIDLKSIPLSKSNLSKFDCVVIATDHTTLDYKDILRSSKIIFDTRNVYKNSTDRKVVRL